MSEFKCVCIKCKNEFVSQDQADFDGQAFCEACKLANKKIAEDIDKQIAAKRANRPIVNRPNIYQEARNKNRKGLIHYMNV